MLNKDDVRYIASLARIHVAEDELEGFTKNLENIISYVDQLNELNVENVEPTSHVLNLENVFRKDEMKPSAARDEALKHAPLTDGKFFKVPKVVERE